MKKHISLFLAVLLMFSLALPVFAEETSGPEPEPDIPEYTYAISAYAYLTIESNGDGTISLWCQGVSGTSSITATVYLQRRINGMFRNIYINGQDYLTRSASGSLLATDIDFDAGYSDHRVKVVYHIVCSSGSETFTVYSNVDSR